MIHPNPGHPPNSKRVLWVVDDSPVAGGQMVAAVQDLGAVELLPDPILALERIAGGDVPDLILLDWEMPEISGIDVCRQLRLRHTDAELPILLCTGNTAAGAVVDGLEAGANDFVKKPFVAAQLRARVKGLLRFHDAAVRERRMMGMVSHDLRNPLSVIMLSVARMEMAVPTDVAPIARRIAEAATRANRLIDDILDVASIREGAGLHAPSESTDLAALALAVVETFKHLHLTRTFRLEVALDGVVGPWSGSRISQVLTNLLDNAVKHGDPTSPVTVRVVGDEAAATIVVSNMGPVIPVELHDSIFEPMRQGPSAAKTKGVGLGLFIVREIARAHGGDVAVTSSTERGTAFTVRLPKRAAQDR